MICCNVSALILIFLFLIIYEFNWKRSLVFLLLAFLFRVGIRLWRLLRRLKRGRLRHFALVLRITLNFWWLRREHT